MIRVLIFFLVTLMLVIACTSDFPENHRIIEVEEGVYNPSVSPDGTEIAFGLLGKIWVVSTEGGEAKQLTFGKEWDHHPVWSPDGRYLAYVHDSPNSSEIVLYNFGTGTSRTLYARSPAELFNRGSWGAVYSFGHITFHPTNGRLYFIDFRSGIWSLDPYSARNSPVQLLPGSGRIGSSGITENSSFDFSSDGRSIIIQKDTTDLWSQLQIAELTDLKISDFTTLDKVETSSVNWSKEGASIAYLEQNGAKEFISIRDTNTTEVKRIDLGVYRDRELELLPDGKNAILVSARKFQRINLESKKIIPIPFKASFSQPNHSSGDLIVTNVNLFDGINNKIQKNVTIEIEAGIITSIYEGSHSGASDNVVDGKGLFLMPGLIDAHAHLWKGSHFQQAMTLTRGITSIVDPGSDLSSTLNLRNAIDHGILEGPNIYTTGPTIDGPEGRSRSLTIANVTESEEARELVKELHRSGVDAIKIYAFLAPDIVEVVIDEAHKVGLPVIGDFVYTSWNEAFESGVDGFIHLMDHKWRFISEDQPALEEGPWAVVEPDSLIMNEFFRKVAAGGTMFDPTMMGSSQYYTAVDFRTAFIDGEGNPEDVQRTKILADILQTMHKHGVKWVAGTDTGPSALIEEMEIYEIIGIPNAEILKTATSNVAKWLKKDDFGSVEVGKRADLILVDGNPLERIRDLEKVELVVKGGRISVFKN